MRTSRRSDELTHVWRFANRDESAAVYRSMHDWRLAAILIVLVAALTGGTHLIGSVPLSRREWRLVWSAVVFLLWLMAGFIGVRSG
jgi:hypothetical protein